MLKRKKIKYGKIMPKNVDLILWDTICIELVGPYTVTVQKHNGRILNAMTFVDPATDWFEMVEITDKTSGRISGGLWVAIFPYFHRFI